MELQGISLKAGTQGAATIKFKCSTADDRRCVKRLNELVATLDGELTASETPQGMQELCLQLDRIVEKSDLRDKFELRSFLASQRLKVKQDVALRRVLGGR